jgi:hypothetical protein
MLRITLSKEKVLYLYFELWNSDLQRTFIFEGDVQQHVKFAEVQSIIMDEGERKAITISKTVKKWIRELYVNAISFEWSVSEFVITSVAEKKSKPFRFVISISDVGEVQDAVCVLDGETHHYHYNEKLENTVFRLLDNAGRQDKLDAEVSQKGRI